MSQQQASNNNNWRDNWFKQFHAFDCEDGSKFLLHIKDNRLHVHAVDGTLVTEPINNNEIAVSVR
jgi:hypothetical protein